MSNPTNVPSMAVQLPAGGQSIYEESTTQRLKLGTRCQVGERVFYYGKAGAGNILAGQVVCAPSAVTTAMGCTVAANVTAMGQNYVTITAGTNIAANALADGYVIISSSAKLGAGVMLKIKSHASFASAGTACVLYTYDDVPVSTVEAGPANVIPNPWNGVIIGSVVLDTPIGVAPIAITSGNYGWFQTWGLAAPIHTAATPLAADLTLGTLGTVIALRSATEGGGATVKSIGKNINLAATANWCQPVHLTIMP